MKRVAYAHAWADEKTGKLIPSSTAMLDHPPKGHAKLYTKAEARGYSWPGQKLVKVKVTYEIVS